MNRLSISTILSNAFRLLEAGNLAVAEGKFCQVLDRDRFCVEAWRGLATIYFQQGNYESALEMLESALDLDITHPILQDNLGLVLVKLGDFSEAIAAFQQAIAIDPTFIEAYHHLGETWVELGKFAEAESIYRQAIAIASDYRSYLHLGHLFLVCQRLDEAIASYETALSLKPRDPDIIYNLGIAFAAKSDPDAELYFGFAAYRRKDYETAIAHYLKFQQTQIGDLDFYLALADCYQHLNQWQTAIAVYQEAIQRYPTFIELYLPLMFALQNCSQVEAARQVADDALTFFPDNVLLKLEKIRLFPILYESQEEIDFYRDRFARELDRFIQAVSLETELSRQQALTAIGYQTNFYLQYQGKNDLALQQQYGQFVHRVMEANYPKWVQSLSIPPLNSDRKIRIGYVSASLQWHTVGRVFLGWLKYRNREEFEVYCYDMGKHGDRCDRAFEIHSDRYYHIPDNLEKVCQQIRSARLDILVFLDIGMYAPMTQLAGLRLAPIQCVAWGHPIASGLPTIDYFISADLLEPKNAASHYCETLIRLPNIGIYYPKPEIPPPRKTRADFGLRDDAVVYLSCQSLFKYLPQYDKIFVAIAQQVPRSQLVFLGHKNPEITERFRQRLRQTFQNFGLNSDDFCLVLPRQTKPDYWNLIVLADVGLDTFGFTGFLTTLEAVAANLPLVTHAGEFMRGRQSAGILTRLGAVATIAQNEADYIKIAVKLGLDKQWNHVVRETIQQGHRLLYEDKTAVTALEAFYRKAVREHNRG